MKIPILSVDKAIPKNDKGFLFVDSSDNLLKLKTIDNLIVFNGGGSISDVPGNDNEHDNEINGESSLSDLVALGILPKQVSEYTDADINSIISIPYIDKSGNNIRYMEFEVVGVNHHKDINDETKPTITLMSKYSLGYKTFDGIERNNPEVDEEYPGERRSKYGNNRWAVSNIRQWLNSSGAANEWFTPQHEYDEPPITSNITEGDFGDYLNTKGFLAQFNNEVKQHFATVRNKTILCNYDKMLLSKDFEETEDKVFLPSYTEMGFGNFDSNNPEGVHLAKKFIDDDSRKRVYFFDEDYGYSMGDAEYWLRTPSPNYMTSTLYVNYEGGWVDHYASYCHCEVFPLIVLC
jgi:hypothetical protein